MTAKAKPVQYAGEFVTLALKKRPTRSDMDQAYRAFSALQASTANDYEASLALVRALRRQVGGEGSKTREHRQADLEQLDLELP